MFVYNTVWRDRRVLKEAESLRRSGWDVTIIGLSLRSDPQPEHEVTPSGVVIRRVPLSLVQPMWRRTALLRGLRRRLHRGRAAFANRLSRRALLRRTHAARFLRRRRAWFRRQALRLRAPDRVRRATHWLAVRARQGQHRPDVAGARSSILLPLRRLARRIGRATEAAGNTASHTAALAWVSVYAGVNRLSDGELDWFLNAQQRWAEFGSKAAGLAPQAAVYHGHDLSGIGAAIGTRDRHGGGAVVYDAHELYVEAGTLAKRSRALKRLLAARERSGYRSADAVITVNASIADELRHRYGEREISLVYNCVAPRSGGHDDRIRRHLGLGPTDFVALYQGALTEIRGLRQMVDALGSPSLAGVHLVFMGFGPMEGEIRALSLTDPRIHLLPSVAPDELDDWVASADVCLMTNQLGGRNELLSTPNKLFESIAAGVPVVTSDFPERHAIVLDPELGPLGAVCDSSNPASIARAIGSVLFVPDNQLAEMRARCRSAALRRWNWQRQEDELLGVYDRIRAQAKGTVPAARHWRAA